MPPTDSVRSLARACLVATAFALFTRAAYGVETATDVPPNIVLIFTDDQGYGDLGCYGSETIRTPHIDRLAEEGTLFTNFYAQVVCGPSRSALLTGRYPVRSLGWSMPASEVTVAEQLRAVGYTTGCIGKWDVSNRRAILERMPNAQGFDYYFGTLGANDSGRVVLHENNEEVGRTDDMASLTRLYTDRGIQFLKQHREEPFFLYLAHTMVHSVIDASEEFRGRSRGGLYGDTVEELDHHTGRLLDALDELGLRESTLVIFTTDNGPWNNLREPLRRKHGGQIAWGSSGPLRAGKGSTYEGGLRVPCIARWPGKVPAGRTSDAIFATIDFLPTFGQLAGYDLPDGRNIDGVDQTALLLGEHEAGARDDYFYFCKGELQAVRKGPWKLVLPGRQKFYGYVKDRGSSQTELYNLEQDIGETVNRADAHPGVVADLLEHARRLPLPDAPYDERIGIRRRQPVPDKLVVLTFDDSVKSHATVAAPLLKRYGFGATFFITEGFSFRDNKKDYLTWEEIRELHRQGFEIGNHTRNHMGVTPEKVARLADELRAVDARCEEHGIPKPVSFAWPGNALAPKALDVLQRQGIRFARRGGAPEYPYERGRGRAYEPGLDHPLLIPSAGDARPDWTLEDFKRAVEQARDGRIAVLQFHGVPDGEHPWVNTPRERFEEYMKYLKDNDYRVIAMRDLAKYVDPGLRPDEPWEFIQKKACEIGRFRARELGIRVGELPTGELNAITDVPGVRVGHETVWKGDAVRTGVTAVLPHDGDLFRDKVPAAFFRYNGFGKPFGTVQVQELGQIETPILLGSTLCVPRIADAVLDHVIAHDASGQIRSVNPVVGETNDGYLSDIRSRPIRPGHVFAAIENAAAGPVAEGAVGAGTGTRCLGFKGGIGTSSRVVKQGDREFVVGVLVQTNFGGRLRILGRELGESARETAAARDASPSESDGPGSAKSERDGSCAIVVAVDAPLTARQLERLARRTFAGMARTGASFSHGSGDYAFAFSTQVKGREAGPFLPDSALSPFFTAAADATQEAIYNSLFQARTVRGRNGHEARAVPLEDVRALFDLETSR